MAPKLDPISGARLPIAALRTAIFYVYLVVVSAIFLPMTLISRPLPRAAWPLTRIYLQLFLSGLGWICGLKYEVEGADNLPPSPYLIASGQQSNWENIAFPLIFANPATWIKLELYRVPIAGWIARANHHIPTDRSGDLNSVRTGMELAREQFRSGRSILIFAEGTRNTTPGQADLKKGASVLYRLLECHCVPVVVDSGLYWGYGRHIIRSGIVRVSILPPIAPGLPRAEFEARLKRDLDEEALRLRRRSNFSPTEPRGSEFG